VWPGFRVQGVSGIVGIERGKLYVGEAYMFPIPPSLCATVGALASRPAYRLHRRFVPGGIGGRARHAPCIVASPGAIAVSGAELGVINRSCVLGTGEVQPG